jgi:hypothetical protein
MKINIAIFALLGLTTIAVNGKLSVVNNNAESNKFRSHEEKHNDFNLA